MLRYRKLIVPVMVLVLAAVEGIKLLAFGPHENDAVLIFELLILGLAVLVVGLLAAALERSEAERARSAKQAADVSAERRDIAQNLHDTLAQNISFLRLKLDQFAGDGEVQAREISAKELEHMRSAAEEAYCQMRAILDDLNPVPKQELSAQLVRQGNIVANRAGFDLRVSEIGGPYTLPEAVSPQILYIIREALHNVEKHAQARCVLLQLVWLEKELIIKVTDDGTGVHPDLGEEDGHYGLWIMHHRAAEIGGAVTVQPASEQGTEVTLWLPRPDAGAENAPKTKPRSAGCEF